MLKLGCSLFKSVGLGFGVVFLDHSIWFAHVNKCVFWGLGKTDPNCLRLVDLLISSLGFVDETRLLIVSGWFSVPASSVVIKRMASKVILLCYYG